MIAGKSMVRPAVSDFCSRTYVYVYLREEIVKWIYLAVKVMSIIIFQILSGN